jgi:hypothetical protein
MSATVDRELLSRNIHVYPPNQKGDAWIAVKFGLAGPHSSIEAVSATETLALSTLRLKLAGHWVLLDRIEHKPVDDPTDCSCEAHSLQPFSNGRKDVVASCHS